MVGNNKSFTQREVEVLDELCTGINNDQIGKNLHISTSTVKTYLGSIGNKLPFLHRPVTRASMVAWWINYRYSIIVGVATAVTQATPDTVDDRIDDLRKALSASNFGLETERNSY